MYIRVFQQASDIDESFEEKLLVGDRPKVYESSESKVPIRERLPERREEETKEVRFIFYTLLIYC